MFNKKAREEKDKKAEKSLTAGLDTLVVVINLGTKIFYNTIASIMEKNVVFRFQQLLQHYAGTFMNYPPPTVMTLSTSFASTSATTPLPQALHQWSM